MLTGTLLLFLAAAAFIGACVAYARSSWHTNDDPMGASLVFNFFWIGGSALLAIGLSVLSVIAPHAILILFAGGFVIGKVIEWFVIDPVLHQLFEDYQRFPGQGGEG